MNYNSATIFCLLCPYLTLYYIIPIFNHPGKEAFWNIVEKGENPSNQHFLLFWQGFLSSSKENSHMKKF